MTAENKPGAKPRDEAQEDVIKVLDLYQTREKIQTRQLPGFFRSLQRWTWMPMIAAYFLIPWFNLDGRQAIWFDLPARKFHVFWITFWPQDFMLLAWALIISAFALFTVTVLVGRVWCGFSCPQTVWTMIFMYIEDWCEGDRNQRIKLDKAPWDGNKILRRGGKFLLWGLVGFVTGLTFVGYYNPIRELVPELFTFTAHPAAVFWTFFFAGMTFMNAGFLREQVCKYMCPYARFQGVMFDPDTLIITYDEERGEPRGSRKKGVDPASVGKGDCIDCSLCVQVCPTGIDIRNGLQYECIGCAACIDACDEVMDKMNYPRGLIRYSTENAVKKHWGRKEIIGHVMRPRTLIYGGILALACMAFVWGLATREPLRVDVIRDRATLSREVAGGFIENVYQLQIMNMTEAARSFEVSVSGLDGIRIADFDGHVEVPSASMHALTLQVQVPVDTGEPGSSNVIHFDVEAKDDTSVAVHEASTFLLPR